MNNTLTALGLALVLALAAALVGPLFVDWSAYRDEVARQAGALLGAPATVAGPVDVRLLPSPYLRVRGLSAGDGEGRLIADEVELTLSIGALLRGDLNAERVRLVRPRLLLSVGADGAVRAPRGPGAGAGGERISFARAEIEDGRVEISAPAGRVTISAVSGFAEAGSLKGPFRFEGHAASALGPGTLRLSTGRADAAGNLRLKLSAALDGRPETFDLDGVLTLAKRPRLDGQIVLARPAGRDGAGPQPWRVGGKIAGDAERLQLSALDLRRGPEEKALKLAGDGALTLAPKPRLDLALAARQIDLDRTGNTTEGDGAAARIAALGEALSPFARPPLDMAVTLDLASVVASGDVARGVTLDLAAEGGHWR
ncbi:AsmA family protein, partial [Methylopila musalis]